MVDYFLGYKTCFHNVKRIRYYINYLLNHDALKIEVNHKQKWKNNSNNQAEIKQIATEQPASQTVNVKKFWKPNRMRT